MFSGLRAIAVTAGVTGVACLALLSACSSDGVDASPAGDCPAEPVSVVVSVSQWGDIVHDLAGGCGEVTTVVSGGVDPHDYEPTPGDLAAFDDAELAVVNGLDYDPWAIDAIDAASSHIPVVDAGEIAGKRSGDNPHVWYGPDYVLAVADAVSAKLTAARPAAAEYFAARADAWRAAMQPYYDEVAEVGATIAGQRTYGATEPVFAYMAIALGLRDETPRGYERSSANEVDPSPADLHDFEALIDAGAIDILVVNTQTSGAVPDHLRREAESAGVPVVEVTESPAKDESFGAWQVGQLRALDEALTR